LDRKLEVKDGVLNAEPGVIVCCGWREGAGGLVAWWLVGLLAGIESSNEAPNDEDGLKGFKPANPVGWDVSGLEKLLEPEETEVAPVA
jgi:hypothetical protein